MVVHLGHGDVVGHDELGERRGEAKAEASLVVDLRDGQLPVDAPHLGAHDVFFDGVFAAQVLLAHNDPPGGAAVNCRPCTTRGSRKVEGAGPGTVGAAGGWDPCGNPRLQPPVSCGATCRLFPGHNLGRSVHLGPYAQLIIGIS